MKRGDERARHRRRQPVTVRGFHEANVRTLRRGEHARERRRWVTAAVVAVPASDSGSATRPAGTRSRGAGADARPRRRVRRRRQPRAVGRRRLARESPVKFGKPRGGHRGGELLVRLSRRRRLHEPRHEQLREPSRVLRPNPRQEVPHARRQTLRVTGTVPVTRSRTGSRRESPDGVHLPGQLRREAARTTARRAPSRDVWYACWVFAAAPNPAATNPAATNPATPPTPRGGAGPAAAMSGAGRSTPTPPPSPERARFRVSARRNAVETTRERLSRRGRVSSERGRTDQRR